MRVTLEHGQRVKIRTVPITMHLLAGMVFYDRKGRPWTITDVQS